MHAQAESIWLEFQQDIRAFIGSRVPERADAEDIFQDVFLKFAQKLDQILGARNMRHYLIAMVRNAIHDHFRRQRPHDPMPELVEEDAPEELNKVIAERCLRPFMAQLPKHYREALLATEFQGLSQIQLAEQLGISYSGAKSRVQRAKLKLRELLESCCHMAADVYGNVKKREGTNCACGC